MHHAVVNLSCLGTLGSRPFSACATKQQSVVYLPRLPDSSMHVWLTADTVSWVQVPLLLSLGEHERALTKAIQAGDPDLVYLALFALQRSQLAEKDKQAAIASRPLAKNLYRAYCALTVGPSHLQEPVSALQSMLHAGHLLCARGRWQQRAQQPIPRQGATPVNKLQC